MALIPGNFFPFSRPVGTLAPSPTSQAIATATNEPQGNVDSFVTSSSDHSNTDWNAIVQQKNLRQMANGRAGGAIVFGGPGDFADARANTQELERIRNQMIDKHGPLSIQALTMGATQVFYEMSPAPAAQNAGEAWGDPASSKSDKAWATLNLGLHALDAIPVAGVIGKGVRSVSTTATAGSRAAQSGKKTLDMASRVRARQSVAGFAKRSGKTTKAATASQTTRAASSGVKKVANTAEFFEKTELGKALTGKVKATGKTFQGAQIYKTSENLTIGETRLRKGYHLYLDNLHKDHIEVFDKRGLVKDVLDLNGNRLEQKFRQAEQQARSIKDLVTHEDRVPQNCSLA